MHVWSFCPVAALLLASLTLSACGPKVVEGGAGAPSAHGRYNGVGIYGPGKQWTKMMAAQQAADPQLARPIDDQVIIVLEDSLTGEVRACGDLTGYCIGMNPWKTALTSGQISPVRMTAHVSPDPEEATVTVKAETQRPKTAPP